MGCASSTEAGVAASATKPNDLVKDGVRKREKSPTSGTEPMASTHNEIDLTLPTKTENANKGSTDSTVEIGDWTVRYACVSKKGRDPDDKTKPNQDSYSVHESFTGPDAIFFGVYDGHGPHGEECSQFVEKRLPELAKEHIEHQQIGDFVSTDQVRASLHMAHTEVNDELRLSKINDAYSGTTAVTLHIQDSRITVCNVGDSRAILGSQRPGATELRCVPLSKDQTPHRADEAARCRRSGARILSFGQINPSENDDPDVEDPPRVWAKTGKYPGTAFTRSIGDAVAEKLGVFAEPEMLTVKISQNEKLIVLASDGIFDVMSNQDVIDMCFKHRDDPKKACDVIIEKSHEEWLSNEECADEESASYDDMTIVCVFLDAKVESGPNTASEADELPQATFQKRHSVRVRQKTLRNLEEMEEN